ncbi:hypothetical protein AA313_de0201822 [Arthrobotrys entomopaga]|nr:hypothetical protein AA313_de0201822 [Arthrobotrys entomopaga]
MKRNLLSLPAELRLEIISHVYQPYITFYYRTDKSKMDPLVPVDSIPDSEIIDAVVFSYVIQPVPEYLLEISPKFSKDVEAFHTHIKTTIDTSLIYRTDKTDWAEYGCGRFTANPSPKLLKIIRNARFIMDIARGEANTVLTMIEANQAVMESISYLCVVGYNTEALRRIMANFIGLETLAFYEFTINTLLWQDEDQKEFRRKYADRHVQLGRTAAFSRLEYIFGVCARPRSRAVNLPEENVDLGINYTRRQMQDQELDGRGRARIFELPGKYYPQYVEDVVYVYEFLDNDAS